MPRQLLDESTLPQEGVLKRRRDVLRDTVAKLSTPEARAQYHEIAAANHKRWQAASKTTDKARSVRVMQGDWGDVTKELSQSTGHVYAVLNMANAYGPGGGYLEGMVAQEENMFRRSDCHFSIADSDMNAEKSHYTTEMTELINGQHGQVYLDITHPRVCIKGSEGPEASGYADLPEEEYFQFYELRAAADNLRHGRPYSEHSMRKKIHAQLETLHTNNIRHVVLSAFGCGAFANPTDRVARLYREELEKMPDCFDEVVFAVYHAGYGPNNFETFRKELDGVVPLQKPNMKVQNELLSKLLKTLEENLSSTDWDQKGFAYPFFDRRKTPNGIEQLRAVFSAPNSSDEQKLYKIKLIAQERLDNPPLFTKRYEAVHKLYQNLVTLHLNILDESDLEMFMPAAGNGMGLEN